VDHFENIIKTLLEAEGYWVRQSFKVNLSKEEKRRIGRPSIPRPEIDLLAFSLSQNLALALEAKSFLDSPGVRLNDLQEKFETPKGRYKLFTCQPYRDTVLRRLAADLISLGMANKSTKVQLGLASGKVYQGRSDEVRQLMECSGWFFWSPDDVKKRVTKLAAQGYENDAAIITAKILMR